MSARRGGQGGFTLVEVMVALLIVATTIASLQAISSATLRSAVATNKLRVAKVLLRAKAEEIYIGQETGTSGEFSDYLGQGVSFPGYSWEMQEQQLQVGEEESVRAVLISVKYPTATVGGEPTATLDDAADGPGVIRLTTYLDPPEAKLVPAGQGQAQGGSTSGGGGTTGGGGSTGGRTTK